MIRKQRSNRPGEEEEGKGQKAQEQREMREIYHRGGRIEYQIQHTTVDKLTAENKKTKDIHT